MAHSYKYLCKRAGLPSPSGFAKIEHVHRRVMGTTRPPSGILIMGDFIEHTATTFRAVCDAKMCPGINLQTAILTMLDELRRLKS